MIEESIKKLIKQSPIQYLTAYRMHQAAQMLTNSELSILQISLCCGFNSSSYFAKAFRASMHCSPREYRKRLQVSGSQADWLNFVLDVLC